MTKKEFWEKVKWEFNDACSLCCEYSDYLFRATIKYDEYFICGKCWFKEEDEEDEEETTIPFMIPKCRKCNVEIGLEDCFIEKEQNKLFHICKDCFVKEDKNEIFERNKFRVKWSDCRGCGETMLHEFMIEDCETLRWYCKECFMNNDIKIVKGSEND